MSKHQGVSGVRGAVDGKDGFVSGHQVISTAGATKHAARMKRVPVWALDNEVLQRLVLARFPRWRTDPKQREKAKRLLRILYLYYREGSTAEAIAEELGISFWTVVMTVRNWNRKQGVSRGLKGGRPKTTDHIGTPSEEVTL